MAVKDMGPVDGQQGQSGIDGTGISETVFANSRTAYIKGINWTDQQGNSRVTGTPNLAQSFGEHTAESNEDYFVQKSVFHSPDVTITYPNQRCRRIIEKVVEVPTSGVLTGTLASLGLNMASGVQWFGWGLQYAPASNAVNISVTVEGDNFYVYYTHLDSSGSIQFGSSTPQQVVTYWQGYGF